MFMQCVYILIVMLMLKGLLDLFIENTFKMYSKLCSNTYIQLQISCFVFRGMTWVWKGSQLYCTEMWCPFNNRSYTLHDGLMKEILLNLLYCWSWFYSVSSIWAPNDWNILKCVYSHNNHLLDFYLNGWYITLQWWSWTMISINCLSYVQMLCWLFHITICSHR